MLRIALLSFFMVVLLPGIAQELTNEQRIAELPALIEQAAAKSNYEDAGKLQRELRIREDLREAVLQKNFERAAELQRELEGKPQPQPQVAIESTPPPPTVTVNRPSKIEFDPRKKFMLYLDFSPVGLSLFTYDTYVYDQNGFASTILTTRSRFALNFKIGNRFYFGRAEGKKLRVGIDANYLSLNIAPSLDELPSLTFSLVRPGVVLNSFITDDLGIDFQFNAGLMTSFSDYIGFSMAGASFNPQVKFWYKKLSAGIDYNLGIFPDDNLRFQYIGLSIGIRK
jgi:hypothetical protein